MRSKPSFLTACPALSLAVYGKDRARKTGLAGIFGPVLQNVRDRTLHAIPLVIFSISGYFPGGDR